jgi:hypothetical protein
LQMTVMDPINAAIAWSRGLCEEAASVRRHVHRLVEAIAAERRSPPPPTLSERPQVAPASAAPMPAWVEFFQWWIVDERTGERRLTPYKLTPTNAQRAFPGAVPDPESREVRWLREESYTPTHNEPEGPQP